VYAKLGKRYWAQERPSIESAVADLPANYVAMGDKIIDTDKLHLLPGKHYTNPDGSPTDAENRENRVGWEKILGYSSISS